MGSNLATRARHAVEIAAFLLAAMTAMPAHAEGTPAGTVISNTATVDFDLDGTAVSRDSNTALVTVVERIDVITTLRSPQLLVAPGDIDRATLFTVTNTGNGTETFSLAIDSSLLGDDFDPDPDVPAIYFDTDGNGEFNPGDEAYDPGTNDPVLTADSTIDVFIVNDIPDAVTNGQTGLSQLTATSLSGTGLPGDDLPGRGDDGVDAVIGSTGGESNDIAEYLVSDVRVNVLKSQDVLDPQGGTQPIPNATVTYTITVEVISTGTVTAATFRDPLPQFVTFDAGSITLNGLTISDSPDADDGEYDPNGAVVVRLGDLTQADGIQTVTFNVTIDE